MKVRRVIAVMALGLLAIMAVRVGAEQASKRAAPSRAPVLQEGGR